MEDVSIAGHYICVRPAGHLQVSTEFADLEGRIAHQSIAGVHALGRSPCVLCRYMQGQCKLNLSFQCQRLIVEAQSQYGALGTCAIFLAWVSTHLLCTCLLCSQGFAGGQTDSLVAHPLRQTYPFLYKPIS